MTEQTMRAKRVLVGMSGGVDSSVCAALLQRQGWEVTGVTLRTWREGAEGNEAEDAARVASHLGIAHYVLDSRERFYQQVVQPFIHSYEQGKTPNPCILCNRHVKFGLMMEEALAGGFDALATGHYASIGCRDGEYTLSTAPFDAKDQSYVLYNLTQQQLAHVVLPLAPYPKEEIRAMAQEMGLPVAHKKDSQEICFIPDDDYAGFICRMTGREYPAGAFVDQQGQTIGQHRGIIHYTVGQRKGLGAFGKPMFVLEIRPHNNTIVLGEKGQEYRGQLLCEQVNWIAGRPPQFPLRCTARVRYKAPRAACTVTPEGEDRLRVEFDQPQRAVTPGQAVVFYQEEQVLGGGVIL
ncbi:MAG: tRNA 2-thiouridine(34) synthase MnmA [Eubacteriales bacterium]|jgi:tRNA-specific 2-thiouridylase